MRNHGPSSANPRTLAIALTLSLLLPAAAVLTADEASAQLEGCTNLPEEPMWIPTVDFYNTTGNQRDLFEDGAVFVDPSTSEKTVTIEARITVENRVEDPTCRDVQGDELSNIEGKIAYPVGWSGWEPMAKGGQVCNLKTGDGECTNLHFEFEIPQDSPLGEHRIRIVAGNDDGQSFTPHAGAERVIVVGQRPDLVITGVQAPDGETTGYNDPDATGQFTIHVENHGDYPAWNPNGGTHWSDRSSFEAPYIPAGQDNNGWGEDDPGDYVPEADGQDTGSHDGGQNELPACHEDDSEPQDTPSSSSWGTWGSVSNCSYRYGVDMPVNFRYLVHQLNPEDIDLPRYSEILETGLVEDLLISESDDSDYDSIDKDEARLRPLYQHYNGAEVHEEDDTLEEDGTTAYNHSFSDLSAVHLNAKAGQMQVNWTVDRDLDNTSLIPERDLDGTSTENRNLVDQGELNNNATSTFRIRGPDLVFDTKDQGGWSDTVEDDDPNSRGGAPTISSADASQAGCGTQQDPCEPGTPIRVQFGFRNAGNWPRDTDDGASKSWRAAIYLNGELAECTNCGDDEYAVWTFTDGIPLACETPTADGCPSDTGTDQIQTPAPEIKTLSGGGLHKIEVRLDDAAYYPDNQLDDRYIRYAEYNETNRCQPATVDLDDELAFYNRYCITLAFNDTEAPSISDLEIDPLPGEDEVSTPSEGDLVTFNATVEDPSTDDVRAILETTDGQEIANLTMSQVSDTSDEYQVKRRIVGQQANNTTAPDPDDTIYLPEDLSEFPPEGLNLTYRVWANDTFGQASNTPGTGILELRVKELPKTIDIVEFEFNGATNADPEQAPTYQGTADDPDNSFNVTAQISGDGREDTQPEEPLEERADATGKAVQVYDNEGELRYTLPMEPILACDGDTSTLYGPENCDPQTPPASLDPPGNVHWEFYVDTSKSEHEDWGDAELDWAGGWHINVTVEDVNNRTGELQDEARFNDQDNGADGLPLLDDVALAPLDLGPGETIEGSAFVRDVLRVERVFLNATHQGSGDTFKLPLTYQGAETCDTDGDACQNAEQTDSGVWAAAFTTGAGEDVARAGTYDVELTAVDFALTKNGSDLGQVTVSDTDDPVIRQFFTLPEGGVQEVGGNVTWQARIDDATAIQPPVLDITFPAQDPKSIEMTFNETSGYWEANQSVPASEIGTWEYEMTVSDYAGHTVSQAGEIEIKKTRPPQVRAGSWDPAVVGTDGSTLYGPAQPTIQLELVDFSDGVDLDSVEMTVNGDTVEFQATAIPNGYQLSHAVGSALSDGDSVTVKVTAADNSGLANEAPLAHSFVVDATGPSATFEADPAEEDDARQIIGDTTEIAVEAEDAGAGPGPVTVTVQHLAGTTATAEETLTFEGGNGTFRLSELDRAFQGHGDYRIVLSPVDAVGNEGSKITKQLLFDKSPPKVQVFAKPGQPREHIFADISDAATVVDAWVLYTPEGDDEERVDLQLVNGTWEGRIPAHPRNTTINFTVKAQDLFGNIGSSPEDSFEAGDAVPTITLTKPSGGDVISGTTELTWTASDLETAASDLKVSLYYKRPGQDFKPIPEAQDIDNLGRYNLDTTILPNGELTLQAIVFDGNNFGDSKITVTVRNLASIFNDPQLEGAERQDGKNLVEPNQEVVFSVQIDGTVQAAVANITDQQGNLIQSVNLEDDGQGNWKGTFQAPTDPGDYNVDLIAQTAEGPVETDNAYTFTVQGAGDPDGNSFVSEWTILSILFAGAVAVGALGLTQRWN